MLKLSVLVLLLSGCASNHHVPLNKDSFTPTEKTTYEEAGSNWGEPEKCREIADYKYCKFSGKSDFVVFKNNFYKGHVAVPEKGLDFDVQVQTKNLSKKNIGKKIFLKKGNVKNWSAYFPYIASIFTANGFEVVKKEKGSDQAVLVEYGFLSKKSSIEFKEWGDKKTASKTDQNTRYLSLKNTGKDKPWKILVTSVGYLKNLDQVIPVLSAASADAFEYENADTTLAGKLNEASLPVVSFKDYVKSKQ